MMTSAHPSASSQEHHSAHVMVVDDTIANLKLMVATLSEVGYSVRPVQTGEQAIRAAEASLPDLVLLDIDLPGMDGYEVCRYFKASATLKTVPIIFMSAMGAPLDANRTREVGALDYIGKPFRIETVIAKLEMYFQ